jgi:hypothetical protein
MRKLILLFLIFKSVGCFSQQYEKSVGLRLGKFTSYYYETQISPESGYRFAYSWNEDGRRLSAHKIFRRYNLDQLPTNISFYYGFGAQVGYERWNQRYLNERGNYWSMKTAPTFGLNGTLGLSYDFKTMPLAITLDLNPYFDYWGRRFVTIVPIEIGLGVVYIF